MVEFNIHSLPIYWRLAPVLSTGNIVMTKHVYADNPLESAPSFGYLSPRNQDLLYFSTYPQGLTIGPAQSKSQWFL